MSNMIYNHINYINWRYEAKRIVLTSDQIVEKLKEIMANRSRVNSKTKRADYTDDTFNYEQKGDHFNIYLYENGQYVIYTSNRLDDSKNRQRNDRIDKIFEKKFIELNGLSLRRAFGFIDKDFKRCIPKQFTWFDKKSLDKKLYVSSIDASSQYPSGCLGKLPDAHTAIGVPGIVKPTEEYPFAFYNTGHLAIYGELDTHEWLDSRFWPSLFRFGKEDYPILSPESLEGHTGTVLMKASNYTMDSTWQHFYDLKRNCDKDTEEYKQAKLVMNGTIGCWHRKDKNKKEIMTYDDHGSYQLAHIVAVAIARGNQKILDMIDRIGCMNIVHICVDGIVYRGDEAYGIDRPEFGKFEQEFTGCDMYMRGLNLYCVLDHDKMIKFKHASYDLLDGKEIPETAKLALGDLYRLDRKERIGDVINEKL